MISIIVGTNRAESKSAAIAISIQEILDSRQIPCQILNLRELPGEILHEDMYRTETQHPSIRKLQDRYISPVEKFIFIIPEYNGSYPGILKFFMDAISVRNYKENFSGKKAFLIGLASGRLGNAIGIEHFSSVLNYVGSSVFPRKLYLPGIDTKVSGGQLQHENDLNKLEQMLEDFVQY